MPVPNHHTFAFAVPFAWHASITTWLAPSLLQPLLTFPLGSETFPDQCIHNSNFPFLSAFHVLSDSFGIALFNTYT